MATASLACHRKEWKEETGGGEGKEARRVWKGGKAKKRANEDRTWWKAVGGWREYRRRQQKKGWGNVGRGVREGREGRGGNIRS